MFDDDGQGQSAKYSLVSSFAYRLNTVWGIE